MAAPTLLLTGATGYIGGAILTQLRNSSIPAIQSLNLAVLVRDDPRAKTYSTAGIKTYFMKDLSDHDAIVAAASQADIVVHVGTGYHPSSPQSHIQGLAQRQAQQGTPTYYVHTSGTSDFGDHPVSKTYQESRTFCDTDDDLYEYLVMREKHTKYLQRASCLAAIDEGLRCHVATTIVTSPTIYGIGHGEYNKISIQIPALIRQAWKRGRAPYIGDGTGTWGYVHIQDLVLLYEAVIADWVTGTKKTPVGKRGILFSGTGTFTWKSAAEEIEAAGQKLGVLNPASLGVESVNLDVAGSWFPELGKSLAEAGFASNARTRAVVGPEQLGWRPVCTERDWKQDFEDSWKVVLEEPKDV